MYSRKEKEKNEFLTRERIETWSLEAWHKLPGY
jgi:hypothetical protein